MHVGVLIPVKANTIEEGKILAQGILWKDIWCWDEENENNNEYAMWDYPYDIRDRWYDGIDENSVINSGLTVKEFKEKYAFTGFISEQNIQEMFEFIYNIDNKTMDMVNPENAMEYIMGLPEDARLYVGAAHI